MADILTWIDPRMIEIIAALTKQRFLRPVSGT
jgi:hypothetical protein